MKNRIRLEEIGKSVLSFYVVSAIFIFIIVHYKNSNKEPLKSNTNKYVEYKSSVVMEKKK